MVSTYVIIGTVVAALAIAGLIGAFIVSEEDDIFKFISKWYFKAEAQAELKALEKTGGAQAQGFLKERLQKNPVVPNEDISKAAEGMGGEAMKDLKGMKF